MSSAQLLMPPASVKYACIELFSCHNGGIEMHVLDYARARRMLRRAHSVTASDSQGRAVVSDP